MVSVAKEYQNRGVPLADLVSAGNMGLITAAERFDEDKGFKFISYAVWWIRQAILQTLAEQSRTVRLPLNKIGLLYKISKASRALQQERTDDPHRKLLPSNSMSRLKRSKRPYCVVARCGRSTQPFSAKRNHSLLDVLPDERQESPENQVMRGCLRGQIEQALSRLIGREAEILRSTLGGMGEEPMTLDQIGMRFGSRASESGKSRRKRCIACGTPVVAIICAPTAALEYDPQQAPLLPKSRRSMPCRRYS